MLSPDDVRQLSQLLPKADRVISYDEMLFIFYKYNALREEARSPKLPPPTDKMPSIKRLLELCKEKIESFLLQLEDARWLKNSTSSQLTTRDADPYSRLLSIRADCKKKSMLPVHTTDVMNHIICNQFIPFPLLHAIYLLPSSAVPIKVRVLLKEKVAFLKAIINERERLFLWNHEKIERCNLRKLLATKKYSLEQIAEAYEYQATAIGYSPKSPLKTTSYSFTSDEHKQRFASRLKEAINNSPYNPDTLSSLMGLSKDTLYTLCKPQFTQQSINFNTLKKLATHLNCTVEFLTGEVENQEESLVGNSFLLRKPTRAVPSHKDFLQAALQQHMNCTSTLELLLTSEKVLLPSDFKEIESFVRNLLADRQNALKKQ